MEPNVVLFFGYMRGGSSFLGGIMENNPDVFYWYEPIWDVYNAMTSSTLWQFPLHVVLDESDRLRYYITSLLSGDSDDWDQVMRKCFNVIFFMFWLLDWSNLVRDLSESLAWSCLYVNFNCQLSNWYGSVISIWSLLTVIEWQNFKE